MNRVSAAVLGAAVWLQLGLARAEGEAPINQFVAGDKLEEMKYRHLWIAYAAIWAFIMLLVWRTAKRQNETAKEILALSARVDEMEKSRE